MSMGNVYRRIARKYGASVAKVKQEMQAAMREACTNPLNGDITRAHQNRVPRKGEIPTLEELFYIAFPERSSTKKLTLKHEKQQSPSIAVSISGG